MIGYGRHHVSPQDVAAVTAVLEGDWLTTGPAVDEFEQALAARTGAGGAVAVTSGTAALHVAYAAAGVGPGSRVLTTPLTFVATAATAMLLGARVDFADVDPETGNISPAAVDALATHDTAVVAAVDYAGLPAEVGALRLTTERVGAVLLEDAAHSIGSSAGGRPVGSLADVTTFSFFPTKNMTTAEGGAVVSSDEALLTRARRFRNHGLVRAPEQLRWPDEGPWHQEVHTLGLNYRLPDVLCALGTSQLSRLDAFVARREQISRRYDDGLRGVHGLRLPFRPVEGGVAWHLYPLRVLDGRRRHVFEGLRARGIGVQVNYVPVYWHPALADLGYQRGLCPAAEAHYSQEVSLPLHVGLHDDQVDMIIDAVRSLVGV